jgi:hypothetical protein
VADVAGEGGTHQAVADEMASTDKAKTCEKCIITILRDWDNERVTCTSLRQRPFTLCPQRGYKAQHTEHERGKMA